MLGRDILIPPTPAPEAPTWPLVTGAHGVAGLAQVAWVAVPPQIAVVSAGDTHQAAQKPEAPEYCQPTPAPGHLHAESVKQSELRGLVQGSSSRLQCTSSSDTDSRTHSNSEALRLCAGRQQLWIWHVPPLLPLWSQLSLLPLQVKAKSSRLQREPPLLPAPPHPPGGHAGPATPPARPVNSYWRTHNQIMIHTKPQAHTSTSTDTCVCTTLPTSLYSKKCIHKTHMNVQLQTEMHTQTCADTQSRCPGQHRRETKVENEAILARLGGPAEEAWWGEREEAGQCEATVQSRNPRHGDATTIPLTSKPCVPVSSTLPWAP